MTDKGLTNKSSSRRASSLLIAFAALLILISLKAEGNAHTAFFVFGCAVMVLALGVMRRSGSERDS